MNKVFIVDRYQNPALLRFIETKIFFDAKNKSTSWANDIEVVNDIASIQEDSGIIIESNQFITTTFRKKYPFVSQLIDARQDPDLIMFDTDYQYSMRIKPPYQTGSKHLYILENLYKTVLRSRDLIYLENTEDLQSLSDIDEVQHFFGLASGWISVQMVQTIGVDRLESITIYDRCQRQLNHQQRLHGLSALPESIEIDPPMYGRYDPPESVKNFWSTWHDSQVAFQNIDLFSTPIFPDNSLIWISNVFQYEPNIFEHGWQRCKLAKLALQQANPNSIII